MVKKEEKSGVVLIYSSKGEILLQLRSATEENYPLYWDFSAAGGLKEGEDVESGALRELKEELGIELDLEYVGEELYENEVKKDRLFIYKTINDGPFNPDGKEVEKVEFFTKDKIKKMLEAGEKFHPEFPFLWDKGIIYE